MRNEHDVDALRRHFSAFAVLVGWSQTGLLAALADGEPRTPAELPGDPRAVSLTAPILAHLGVLVRYPRANGEEAWALSNTARAMESEGALRLDSWENLQALAKIDQLLTSGGPLRATDIGVRRSDVDGTRSFMEMLYRRSATSAAETARLLVARAGRGRVLDLGGGHGRYAHELAARGFEVTLFDQPLVCELARERYGDTLHYLPGDFHADDLGGPWDLVLASNIVHGLGPGQLEPLLRRVAATLAKGGALVLKDLFVSCSRDTPEVPVLFNLVMLMFTREGRSPAVDDMRNLLMRLGFSSIEHIHVGDQGFSLLLAS